MIHRRWIALLLLLALAFSVLPPAALAAPGAMEASDELIEFIKSCEGFTKYAHWDYSHYSIGYGSMCEKNEYPDGITEEQADALLRRYVAVSAASVNSFVRTNGMSPTQNQFDCMVTVAYGLGTEWMLSKYDLPKLFIRGAGELELLNCLGDWVTAGGTTLDGLIFRRMRETYIYAHGEYNMTGNIAADTPYACLKFDAKGGTLPGPRIYTYRGSAYGLYEPLPTPTRSGYRFLGWYDAAGNRVTNDTVATTVLTTAYARWEKGSGLFTDVYESDWFYADVKAATEQGLFAGYADGSFRPQVRMSRAMFAQVLYRIAGEPKEEADLPFTDVAASAWYADAVRWAYGSRIVNGVSADRFAPDRDITREQMATMLYQFIIWHGSAEEADESVLSDFADADAISPYAREPMCWAVQSGLIRGVGDATISPKTYATRAQAAAMLVRLLSLHKSSVA